MLPNRSNYLDNFEDANENAEATREELKEKKIVH